MADEKEAKSEKPKIGPGSPAGKRWFVTRYPELVLTLTPEDHIIVPGVAVKQKPTRVQFIKQLKPARLLGAGYLGTVNTERGDGSDLNDALEWGVAVIEDAKTIEVLRAHPYYRETVQDDRVERNAKLKELSWDPRVLPSAGRAMRGYGRDEAADRGPDAPADGGPVRTDAKVGLTAKK